MLCLRKYIRAYLLPSHLLSTGERGSLSLWCNDFFSILSFEHLVIPSYRYGFFFVVTDALAMLRNKKQFEGQMRIADDVKGAREGRDIIQCRGSCLYKKKHVIGVITTNKADVYNNLACLNQF